MNTYVWEFVKTAVIIMVIFCILLICLSIIIMTIQAIFHTLFFSKSNCPPPPKAPVPAPAPTKSK